MRRTTRVTPAPRGRRPAFTLVELIVVIAIIVLLAGLTTAAVMEVLAVQQKRATEATIQKVASELDRQWKAVVDQAKNEQVPSSVLTQLAGNDPRRARVIWIKLRLKQEFPMSYAEAKNPDLGLGYISAKNAFKVLPPAANDPYTESSACLLLALTQGHRGVTWDVDQSLGAGFAQDTDGDGFKEIVDTWGKALYFVRWPTTNPDLNPALAPVQGINDNQDPDGLLSDPSWVNTGGAKTFQTLCGSNLPWQSYNYQVAAKASYKNLNPFVASAGPDGARLPNNKCYGTGDDIYSYRLRSLGSRGD